MMKHHESWKCISVKICTKTKLNVVTLITCTNAQLNQKCKYPMIYVMKWKLFSYMLFQGKNYPNAVMKRSKTKSNLPKLLQRILITIILHKFNALLARLGVSPIKLHTVSLMSKLVAGWGKSSRRFSCSFTKDCPNIECYIRPVETIW